MAIQLNSDIRSYSYFMQLASLKAGYSLKDRQYLASFTASFFFFASFLVLYRL